MKGSCKEHFENLLNDTSLVETYSDMYRSER